MSEEPANRPEQEPTRNADGTWPKGVSGNPNGRPKAHAQFRDLMRDMTPEAVKKLKLAIEKGDLDAIKFVIEQGWGKAVTAPAEDGSGENVQRVVYELRVKDGA